MYYLRKANETEAAEKLRSFLRQDSSDTLLLALHLISVTPPQAPSERARNHNTYPGAPFGVFAEFGLSTVQDKGQEAGKTIISEL